MCYAVHFWLSCIIVVLCAPLCCCADHSNNITLSANLTATESGAICTTINRRCVAKVRCVKNQCVCPPPLKGNGLMECTQPDKHLCILEADPHLKTYGGALGDVSLPCNYRLTRFVVDATGTTTRQSKCSVEVNGINELVNGKYFVHSVLISIGISDHGAQTHSEYEFRHFGVTDDDVYSYLTNVNHTSSVWGFSQPPNVKDVEILPWFDHVDKFAVLEVKQCDTRIKYRAFKRGPNARQTLLPGISIAAPSRATFEQAFGGYPNSLCGTPSDSDQLLKTRANTLGVKSPTLAVLYDILNSKHSQRHNPMEVQCKAAIKAFADSNNKAADINTCGPVTIDKGLTACLQNAGFLPIEIMTACLRYQTNPNPADCKILRDAKTKCSKEFKGLPAISC